MDPTTVAIVAPIAGKLILAGLGLAYGWIVHRTHSQTVQAVAQLGQKAAVVAVPAAVDALAGGASGKAAAVAAGAAALGVAADGKPVLGPPAP